MDRTRGYCFDVIEPNPRESMVDNCFAPLLSIDLPGRRWFFAGISTKQLLSSSWLNLCRMPRNAIRRHCCPIHCHRNRSHPKWFVIASNEILPSTSDDSTFQIDFDQLISFWFTIIFVLKITYAARWNFAHQIGAGLFHALIQSTAERFSAN